MPTGSDPVAQAGDTAGDLLPRLAELEAIHATARIGLAVFDRQMRYVRINRCLADMNGVPVEAHLGRTVHEVVPGLSEAAEAMLRRILATGEAVLDVELVGETPARPGVRRTWLTHWSPVRGADGAIAGISVVAEEITARLEVERERARSEERFRALAIASSDVIYRMNADWTRMEQLTVGGTTIEPPGDMEAWIARHVEPRDEPRVRAAIGRAVGRSTPFELEHRFRRADGTVVWVRSRAVPLLEADGTVREWIGTATDVTARKRRERGARLLESLVRALDATRAPDEIMAQVGARLGAELGISACNFCEVDDAADRLVVHHGWRRDDVPDLRRVYVLSQYIDETFREASRAGRTVAIDDTDTDPRTDAGAYASIGIRAFVTVPFRQDGRWTGLLSVIDSAPRAWSDDEIELFRDLADAVFPRLQRLRAEALLQESERRFRLMADGTPLMIWVLDPEGRLEYVNAAHRAFFGMEEERVPSTDWTPLIHDDDVAAVFDAVARARESRSGFRTRARVLRADGAWRWIQSDGAPRLAPDGRLEGFVGSSADVTEIVEAERALQEADRRKDEFLATLAHELRNPLAPVRNGLRLIARAELPDTARRAVDICERQLHHMGRLIDDLLDVSRITRGKIELSIERVCVRRAVHATADALGPEFATRGQRLELALDAAPLEVDADPVRLAQILENLLSNASKYTDPDGQVTIAARRDGDAVRVEVSDTGIGIAEKDLPRLFEPFVQIETSIDRARGGLGIGLALVRQLVTLHGGRVAARSDGLGRGSTFSVSLPLARGRASTD